MLDIACFIQNPARHISNTSNAKTDMEAPRRNLRAIIRIHWAKKLVRVDDAAAIGSWMQTPAVRQGVHIEDTT